MNRSQIVDHLNNRYGAETLSFGLVGQQQPWRLRCNQRSPRFTTHWDELPRGQAGFGTMEAGKPQTQFSW
jgi:DNA polymerase V